MVLDKAELFEEAIEDGTVIVGNSIDELADQLNINIDVLTNTINKYNGACELKVDEEFGKPYRGLVGNKKENEKEVVLLNPIKEPPFYAINFITNGFVGTTGGPVTDIEGRVIDTSDKLIPGLFAAGEVANGDLFYHEYPCSGSSIQFALTMGLKAGESAAQHSR